jgi:hypothetical protein
MAFWQGSLTELQEIEMLKLCWIMLLGTVGVFLAVFAILLGNYIGGTIF